MKAIFVNEPGGIRYALAIVKGIKPIETRSRNMLKSCIGERVAVIRTRSGKAPMIVGYVTITSALQLGKGWLDANRDKTLIPEGSKYDCKGASKWCYFLTDAEECDPYPLPSSAVRHGRSWCEIDPVGEDPRCNGDCDYCIYKSIVPGTDERIDREPKYFCSLYEKM